MTKTKRPFIAAIILALAALPAFGDTKMTMQEGTGTTADGAEVPEEMRQAFANQEPTTAVYWISKDRAARVGDSGSIISRLDKGESYFVNHQSRSYTVIELGGLEGPASETAASGLVKTGETRKIGSWNAVGYRMTLDMGGEAAEVVLWISDEVDVDLAAYRAFIRANAAQPGSEWMLKFIEIDGFPVRQEVRIGPIASWQQLISVSDETAPQGTYDPPADYTLSDGADHWITRRDVFEVSAARPHASRRRSSHPRSLPREDGCPE